MIKYGCKVVKSDSECDALAFGITQPCNPAVGGPAKSQLVHEVDALGGEIGRMADRFVDDFLVLTAIAINLTVSLGAFGVTWVRLLCGRKTTFSREEFLYVLVNVKLSSWVCLQWLL